MPRPEARSRPAARPARTRRPARPASISSIPAAHSSGPTVSGMRGPIRWPSSPARADSSSISTVVGSSAGAGAERRVAGHHLELERGEEEESAEGRVHAQRDQVDGGELAGREDRQRQHRVGPPPLHVRRRRPPAAARDRPRRDRGRRRRASISAYVDAGQRQRAERGPEHVEAPVRGRSRLSGTCRSATGTHTAASGRFSRNTHRQPGPSTSQPPRNGPTAAPTPPSPDHGADRPRPVLRVERGLDQRERARGQQRAADALQRPGGDQHPGVRRDPAQQRGEREPHHPDHEHLAPPVPVAERPAEQDQAGQGERVPGDYPL